MDCLVNSYLVHKNKKFHFGRQACKLIPRLLHKEGIHVVFFHSRFRIRNAELRPDAKGIALMPVFV